jgi:hypothetical protein
MLNSLSDLDLVARFRDLLIEERERLVLTLEAIAELDRRKLFFHCSSLRAYLVEECGMEEWQAERRIRAARLLQRFPELKQRLESGKLNLTLMELAQGCAHREKLPDQDLWDLLEAVSGMSSRRAMREIASRYPRTTILPKDQIRPLNEDFSEVRFTASQELLEKLEEIRGLLAHSSLLPSKERMSRRGSPRATHSPALFLASGFPFPVRLHGNRRIAHPPKVICTVRGEKDEEGSMGAGSS